MNNPWNLTALECTAMEAWIDAGTAARAAVRLKLSYPTISERVKTAGVKMSLPRGTGRIEYDRWRRGDLMREAHALMEEAAHSVADPRLSERLRDHLDRAAKYE